MFGNVFTYCSISWTGQLAKRRRCVAVIMAPHHSPQLRQPVDVGDLDGGRLAPLPRGCVADYSATGLDGIEIPGARAGLQYDVL